MGPPKAKIIANTYRTGYVDGYNYILRVLRGCAATRTHLNPVTARLLNESLDAIALTLEEELPKILEDLDAHTGSTPQ